MNQSGFSTHDPIIVDAATTALLDGAARDLEDFSEEVMTPLLGHWPSWDYPLPDGLALCVGCWRPITAPQLGVDPCPGTRREQSGGVPEMSAIHSNQRRAQP